MYPPVTVADPGAPEAWVPLTSVKTNNKKWLPCESSGPLGQISWSATGQLMIKDGPCWPIFNLLRITKGHRAHWSNFLDTNIHVSPICRMEIIPHHKWVQGPPLAVSDLHTNVFCAHQPDPNFSFLYTFSSKSAYARSWRPLPMRVGAPQWEILDPPHLVLYIVEMLIMSP